MSDSDSGVVGEARQAAAEHGLTVFAGWPSDPTPVLFRGSLDDFLDLACTLNVSMLYLTALDPDPEVKVRFLVDGKLHMCTYTDQHRPRPATSTGDPASDDVERLARQVVDDAVFYDHGSRGREQRKLARTIELLPGIDEALAKQVVTAANRIDRTERQGPREREWARTIYRIVEVEGRPKQAAADHIGIGQTPVSRLLYQHGLVLEIGRQAHERAAAGASVRQLSDEFGYSEGVMASVLSYPPDEADHAPEA